MPFFKDIHKFQHQFVDGVQYITILLYILIALGLSKFAPQYLTDLQKILKIYVGVFLVYRFNPFRNIEFTSLDRKVAFDAGILLIGSDLLNYILVNYPNQVNSVQNVLQNKN